MIYSKWFSLSSFQFHLSPTNSDFTRALDVNHFKNSIFSKRISRFNFSILEERLQVYYFNSIKRTINNNSTAGWSASTNSVVFNLIKPAPASFHHNSTWKSSACEMKSTRHYQAISNAPSTMIRQKLVENQQSTFSSLFDSPCLVQFSDFSPHWAENKKISLSQCAEKKKTEPMWSNGRFSSFSVVCGLENN